MREKLKSRLGSNQTGPEVISSAGYKGNHWSELKKHNSWPSWCLHSIGVRDGHREPIEMRGRDNRGHC